MSQNFVLLLLGCALLRISLFSTTYVNYVKLGFRPLLIASGFVLLLLSVIGSVQAWRKSSQARGEDNHHPHDGHDHSHGPKVAWLMCLPVFAIFLIAPPALGSFAASRSDEAPPPPPTEVIDAFAPLTGREPTEMTISEFIGRAWDDKKKTLAGHPVRLTGFVSPAKKKGTWYVTRMVLACCAADAYALKVKVSNQPQPRENSWVEVTGTWVPPKWSKLPNGVVFAELAATDVQPVEEPSEPYE
ncbi:TIGR03943 family putative permease subunit [Streptosporangium sp. NPDC087985]|uniref:TIGR03943 family putative permease subunit n=1 Tax=Streptosporangium sp. NPDC087985 TaxID=3366196 RepID=UPI00380A66DF